jgi:hypothetical protein
MGCNTLAFCTIIYEYIFKFSIFILKMTPIRKLHHIKVCIIFLIKEFLLKILFQRVNFLREYFIKIGLFGKSYLFEDSISDDGSLNSRTHALSPDTNISSLLAIQLLQLTRVEVGVTIKTCD